MAITGDVLRFEDEEESEPVVETQGVMADDADTDEDTEDEEKEGDEDKDKDEDKDEE